jgi:divalent metal cation (Fe/Co/Zn/Cd) transporter
LLLDVSLSQKEVKKIEDIINNEEKVKSFHELRTRQS